MVYGSEMSEEGDAEQPLKPHLGRGLSTSSTRESSPAESESITCQRPRPKLNRSRCVDLDDASLQATFVRSRSFPQFVSDIAKRISEMPLSSEGNGTHSQAKDEPPNMIGSLSWALRHERQEGMGVTSTQNWSRPSSASRSRSSLKRSQTLNSPGFAYKQFAAHASDSPKARRRPLSAALGRKMSCGRLSRTSPTDTVSGCSSVSAMEVGNRRSSLCDDRTVETIPLKNKKLLDFALTEVFGMFAVGRQRLYLKDFELLCRNTLLFDNQFDHSDARAIFTDLLSGGLRYIPRQQFKALLREVAFHKQYAVEAIHRIVIDGAHSQQWLR
mmetsp:Transcript_66361/g.104945  ORF Transcript_66361/g.104945 Transcript_66361/m.104945 type:complete len:328 (+) Transcript_66361:60-1043(+)